MLNSFLNQASSPWYLLWERCQKPLAGLLLAVGIVAGGVQYAVASSSSQTVADGIYLYGQVAEPDQIGAAYMVFEVRDRQVTGAFYMPYSSFDCFNGAFQNNQLALTVIDSYSQEAHPYMIAWEPTQATRIASRGETVAPVVPNLQGYHALESVSDNDLRMLNVCQSDVH